MSKSILSINGNKAMNYLLRTLFQKEYRFVPVENIFQAMYQLRSDKSIELLIVDVDYHPQESWEFIEHIKTSKLYNIPLLVLTTENNEDLRRKCYEFGIDDIFFKPFNPMDIIAAVNSTINSFNTVNTLS
ncbi:MAG TPA: response regulator [Flavisolibacter sp.]|jgi:putative two-component system response regulator|nr:response regulator [Flavisolibacter sp.]